MLDIKRQHPTLGVAFVFRTMNLYGMNYFRMHFFNPPKPYTIYFYKVN